MRRLNGAQRGMFDIAVNLRRVAPCAVLLISAACAAGLQRLPAAWSPDLPAPRLADAAVNVDTVDRGVLRRSFTLREGPWAVHVLDIDRHACWKAVAVKGGPEAIGRRKTSELITLARGRAVGAVNADFFLFAPAGLPVGAHVEAGRVVTGPVARPVFATDSSGRPWIGVLRVLGAMAMSIGMDSFPIQAWNRPSRDGLAYFDSNFGAAVDTSTGTVRVVLDGVRSGRVVAVDTALAPTHIPRAGSVLVAGSEARGYRAQFRALSGDPRRVLIAMGLTPLRPAEAVGGFPILVRDSAEVAGLDSAGAATFAPVRHPRSIVATAAGGRRLMLIVVDGRQPGYSAGMTLREAARLTLQLGATDAINLDGGGSSTLVIGRPSTPNVYEIVNRPSDPAGERPVANALAIVKGC